MKVYYLFILILILPIDLFAQSRQSEFSKKIANAKNDSEKAAYYKDIIYDYKPNNEDSAVYYAQQGLELFTKTNYKIGQGWMLSDLSDIDDDHGRGELAKKRSQLALDLFKEVNYPKGIAEVNNSLGIIEAKSGNFELAISFFLRALKGFDSLKNTVGVMRQYSNLAIAYEHYKDPTKALTYLMIADSIGKKLPLSDAVINLSNDIGVYYFDRGDTARALKYFEEGLKKSNKPEFFVAHLTGLINTGMLYHQFGKKQLGIQYLEEALKISREEKFPEEEANTLNILANILKETDKAKAMTYLENALEISLRIKNKPLQADLYKSMEELYKLQNDYKQAYDAREKRQAITDSIFTVNKSTEIASIGAIYDLERSNLKVHELEEQGKQNARKRNIIIDIAVFAIVSLIVLVVFYRRTTRLNKRLVKQETELKEMNAMKDKLFSVIGHDLRTPIARIPAILEIYEDKETSPEEKSFLLNNLKEHTKASVETFDKLLFWGQTLVKGVILNKTKVQAKQYVRENIELKKMQAADKSLTVRDNVPTDVYLLADATHFDFVVRNLLANAIKYTHANGIIEVNADTRTRAGFTIFSVSDTGIGIRKELQEHIFEPSYSTPGTADEMGTGIGLMLCKEFAIQNGGDIWVESEQGKGSTFFFAVRTAA